MTTTLSPRPNMARLLPHSLYNILSSHQWALAITLLSLHGLLIWGLGDQLQSAFVLLHYGCFLLWQPILQNEHRLSWRTAAALVAGGVALMFFLNWWLIAFWLCLLFALLGGRIFSTSAKSARLGYMLAAGYVMAIVLLWVVPQLISEQSNIPALRYLVIYGLPLIPAAILLTRTAPEQPDQPMVLDFFYTLMLLMFSITMVLGSYAIATSTKALYPEVLLNLLFALAAALVAVSWLWNPRAGFSGFENLLSRYLLSVGLPFENWVKSVAELADQKTTSKGFIEEAVAQIGTLPWVSGIDWQSPSSTGETGMKTAHFQTYGIADITLQIYTRWPLSPALTLHAKLLVQILGEFYEAKRREETMTQNAYMQAVYETGSRLTHDIKNLVQSMGALCSAAEQTQEADSDRLLALIKRQLPLLNQRMARTLEKLQAPKKEAKHYDTLSAWWESFSQNFQEGRVHFTGPAEPPAIQVESDVLDSIIDNLIQNALAKARNDTGLQITVSLTPDIVYGYALTVSDSGKPMPEETALSLFKKQVRSETGLGIGLYHAGKQAEQSGLQLALIENRAGAVTFQLRPQAPTV